MNRCVFPGIALLVMISATAEEGGRVRAELEPLEFLVGACWAGKFPGDTQTDIHCVEAVYGGAHIRDRHAVIGGAALYEGETIYSWNGETNQISYVYWNSLGGVSMGTATPQSQSFEFPKERYKGPDGETVIVSTYWENIDADGYDSLSVETYPNGEKRERRVRYEKRPFVADPSKAL